MSRSIVLVTSSLVCASVACTVNGHAVGPHLAVTTGPAPRVVASASAPAPTPTPSPAPAPSPDASPPVPSLLGMTLDEAKAAVARAGIAQPVVIDDSMMHPQMACEDDRVCGQTPDPGDPAPSGESIYVMLGHHDASIDLLIVPDVTGMSIDDAKAAIKRAGFTTPVSLDPSSRCETGRVCALLDVQPGQPWRRGNGIRLQVGPLR